MTEWMNAVDLLIARICNDVHHVVPGGLPTMIVDLDHVRGVQADELRVIAVH